MRVLGVVVAPSGKNPRVYGVILDGTVARPTFIDEFELRTPSVEPSEQAVDLARMLSGKLGVKKYERAGIRTAGTTPVARRSKAAFSRAHAEGALLFVMRESLGSVVATVDSVSAPRVIGIKKDELDALVSELSSSGGNRDAILAALAALAAI